MAATRDRQMCGAGEAMTRGEPAQRATGELLNQGVGAARTAVSAQAEINLTSMKVAKRPWYS